MHQHHTFKGSIGKLLKIDKAMENVIINHIYTCHICAEVFFFFQILTGQLLTKMSHFHEICFKFDELKKNQLLYNI